MRRFAAIIFAAIMLVWTAAPLLACLMPGHDMTVQERECCKKMADMCGSADMPQSHSCCKTEVRNNSTIVVKADQRSVPVLVAVAPVTLPPSPKTSSALYEVEHHRPPNESLPDPTILRI